MAAKRIPPAKLAHIIPELRQLAVPIADLVPDPVNAKGHPPEQVKAIAASFREFKQDQPIVVQREGMIVRKGNGRLLGAIEAGYEYLAAIVVDESETRAVARALADNRLSEMGTWDHRRLGELLGKVRDAHDVDVAVTGYDEGLIRKFLARAATIQTGVDPDEIPAASAVPVSKRGDLWLLGEHRLLCGDATNKDDVERVCFGRNPVLMVTDPPYGVDYNPQWRQDAADNGEIAFGAKRLGKVQNDDRADWTAAWELFKGDVAYVWHASLRALIVGGDLERAGYDIRCVIIWRKPSFAISRGHYHWQHEPCQPAGTLVMVPEGPRGRTGWRPIEELRDGDRVVSWGNSIIHRRGQKIKATSRHYDGQIHTVTAGGKSTRTTHSHHWTVRCSAKPTWLVYLMRSGDRWRIGFVSSFNARGFGPTIRLKDERGDAVWVLSAHSSAIEARIYEQALSVKYGIPTTHWNVDRWNNFPDRNRDAEGIARIYEIVGPLGDKAERILAAYGRHIDLPLATNEGVRGGKVFFSRSKTTIVRSCNLIPGLMEVPIPTDGPRPSDPGNAGREGSEWAPISSVERSPYSGLVYSLAVARDKHYVADGLVTHNCYYAVRKGGTAAWVGDRSQASVWDMATVNMSGANPDDAQTDHGTQKPVEAMARPMRNHGKENDDVYDPFCGSGSSIIAAEGLNRRCCALEIEPTYVDVIVNRWQNFAGKEATHEATGKTFAEIMAERLKPKGKKRGGRKAK